MGFTQDEIATLKEFRRRVSDILPDEWCRRDDTLIRWLRARDMDIEKAEEMIRKSMEWRKDNSIDSILDDGIDPEMTEKFPFYYDGVDKRGRPVVTFPFGLWDIKAFVETEGPEKFHHYMIQVLETIRGLIKKRTYEIIKEGKNDPNWNEDDQPCIQYLSISDMTGYSIRQLGNMKAVQSLIQMVSVFEAHYPESVGGMITLNAPTVFSILFGMVKPFMSAATLEKFKIFGTDREQWEPAVLDIVESSEIREEYGGTKVCERL